MNSVAMARGLIGPDTVSLGIYYGNPDVTPVEQLRSHACVSVPSNFGPAPEGFEILDLEGGEHAVGVHRGPYTRLPESYRWLFGEWFPSSGRQPANRASHEIYLNDPRAVPPEELVTHICIPLARG
jgi:AraC family transcriptional regulator